MVVCVSFFSTITLFSSHQLTIQLPLLIVQHLQPLPILHGDGGEPRDPVFNRFDDVVLAALQKHATGGSNLGRLPFPRHVVHHGGARHEGLGQGPQVVALGRGQEVVQEGRARRPGEVLHPDFAVGLFVLLFKGVFAVGVGRAEEGGL